MGSRFKYSPSSPADSTPPRQSSSSVETANVSKLAADVLADGELYRQRLLKLMQLFSSSGHDGISQTPNLRRQIGYPTTLSNFGHATPRSRARNGILDVATPVRSTHEKSRALVIDSDSDVEEIDFHEFSKRREPNDCQLEEGDKEDQIREEADEEDKYTISAFIGRLNSKKKEDNRGLKSDAVVEVEEKMVCCVLTSGQLVDESVDFNILNVSDEQQQWTHEEQISQSVFCFPRKKRSKTRHIKLQNVKTAFEVEDHVAAVNSHINLLNLDDFPLDVKSEDCFQDLWQEMCRASECTKTALPPTSDVQVENNQNCEHSFILKDDLGYVCKECGFLQQKIETIFDFSWAKVTKSSGTYLPQNQQKHKSSNNTTTQTKPSQQVTSEDGMKPEICVHPSNMKQMKNHQLDGFEFLTRNLLGKEARGCILAHAPGSGKTFMLISFVQSFLARYPLAKPLVVLPKGIVATWKKEFIRWHVEDISLLHFYSTKAEKRTQQLDVLQKWVEQKSILFLGYKQFANIVCGYAVDEVEKACQKLLVEAPSILILDEGHTARNDETEMLCALAKVQTERKVVLSGTLYQNNVKEVFNIIDLVCPKFMKLESSRDTVRRILSKVNIPSECGGRLFKNISPSAFFDMVELVLQNDDFKSKVALIQELRDMTKHILHYYKGDFLDELPGLQDLVVFLNLSSRQKAVLQSLDLEQTGKFKRSSLSCIVALHPDLKRSSENTSHSNEKLDKVVENMNLGDGVKAKFFLNLVKLAESVGEKILVFSQFVLPLKFLERLLVKEKGWRLNKEMFLICGDSSSDERDLAMQRFNETQQAKVLFGSIKACGEGISLVGASRVLILDVHLNPSVTRQAIGRAFRPGQLRKVYIYRLVAAETTEQEDHEKAYKKEVISKMWFEWEDFKENTNFQLETVDLTSCDDILLESPILREDIQSLYRRR